MKKLMVLMLGLFLFSLASAANSEPSYCCERTTSGAWCANDVESACDASYNAAPTSCESTSYCRLGTCYDSDEGICMGNTPQKVCNDNGGTWDPRPTEEVPQCQLGCCVLTDQAAFVSLTRCKKLSTFFGVENDYRTNIFDEVSCIAEAQSQDVGACVYESDFERLCDFTTRGECGAGNVVESLVGDNVEINSGKTFYKDVLCSADELATSCARQTTTGCYQGDVLWMDSCDNRENVYSNDRDRSWNNGRVSAADDVCVANDGSNVDCGNCDYMLGSRCAEFEGLAGGPAYGDNYCQRTQCVDSDGNDRINGESWCVGGGDDVGDRAYRELCVDGEVKVEACGDYRSESCIEGSVQTSSGDFGTAACRVNRWQDCVFQAEKGDCLNIDRRDCKWMPSVLGMILSGVQVETSGTSGTSGFSNPTSGNSFNNPTASLITGNAIFDSNKVEEEADDFNGVCVPNYAPGLNFWEEGSANAICGQAAAKCTVEIELNLLEGLTDKISDFEDALKDEDYDEAYTLCKDNLEGENCECLTDDWARDVNGICGALGDCGGAMNYNNDYNNDGYKLVINGKEAFFE